MKNVSWEHLKGFADYAFDKQPITDMKNYRNRKKFLSVFGALKVK